MGSLGLKSDRLLDHAKAAALYRKAAEQGHADAQYHLAVSYDDGEGVPQDFKQAVYWYTQAAARVDALSSGGMDDREIPAFLRKQAD